MFEVDDDHIDRAAHTLTANPNCYVLHSCRQATDGSYTDVCKGRLTYAEGKVKIHDTCGEPCSFVCKTSREFAEKVGWIRTVLQALQATKAK